MSITVEPATTNAADRCENVHQDARRLAELGWSLTPVTIRINPTTGKKKAQFHLEWTKPEAFTTDPEQITRWHKQFTPTAWAQSCTINGVDVSDLDINTTANGIVTWRELGLPESTMRIRSNGGGWHDLWARVDDDPLYCQTARLPGVDTKSISLPTDTGTNSGGVTFICGYVIGSDAKGWRPQAWLRPSELPTCPANVRDALRHSTKPATSTRQATKAAAPPTVDTTGKRTGRWTPAQAEKQYQAQMDSLARCADGSKHGELLRVATWLGVFSIALPQWRERAWADIQNVWRGRADIDWTAALKTFNDGWGYGMAKPQNVVSDRPASDGSAVTHDDVHKLIAAWGTDADAVTDIADTLDAINVWTWTELQVDAIYTELGYDVTTIYAEADRAVPDGLITDHTTPAVDSAPIHDNEPAAAVPDLDAIRAQLDGMDADKRRNLLAGIVPLLIGTPVVAQLAWKDLCAKNGIGKRDFGNILKETKAARQKADNERREQELTLTDDDKAAQRPPFSFDGGSAKERRFGVDKFLAHHGATLTDLNGDLFVYQGALARYMVTDTHKGTREIVPVTPAMLCDMLRRNAEVYTVREIEEKEDGKAKRGIEQHPDFLRWCVIETDNGPRKSTTHWEGLSDFPLNVAAIHLDGRHFPGTRVLREICHKPVIDEHGRDVATNGYDPESGLLIDLDVEHPLIPAHPTRVDALNAAAELRKIFGDTTWKGDTDYANFIAMFLTVVVRRYLTGRNGGHVTIPGYAVRAPAKNSGKSTVCNAIGGLYGRAALRYKDDENELAKAVLSIYMSPKPAAVAIMNNLPNKIALDSAILADLITESQVSDRILGVNKHATIDNEKMLLINGNRFTTVDDLSSRFVLSEIQVPTAADRRRAYHVDGLIDLVDQPRFQAMLLGYGRTIVRAWIEAGSPIGDHHGIRANFRTWAEHLDGILTFLGISGFLLNWGILDAESTDPDEGFLQALHTHYGDRRFTADDVARTITAGKNGISLDGCSWTTANVVYQLVPLTDRMRRLGTLPEAKGVGNILLPLCDMPFRSDEDQEEPDLRLTRNQKTKEYSFALVD